MPWSHRSSPRRVRSAEGKKLDKMYANHEIGWAHYYKIKDKPKYWQYL